MRPTSKLGAALFAAALLIAPAASFAASPLGDWLVASRDGKVRIAPCGEALCGVLVWARKTIDPKTGRPQLDIRNPDPALRGRPILGMRLFWGMKPDGPNHWSDGRIYDARSGRTYRSKLALLPNGDLKVEGCLGPFCGGQTWTPVG